jgi:hypothetical protein
VEHEPPARPQCADGIQPGGSHRRYTCGSRRCRRARSTARCVRWLPWVAIPAGRASNGAIAIVGQRCAVPLQLRSTRDKPSAWFVEEFTLFDERARSVCLFGARRWIHANEPEATVRPFRSLSLSPPGPSPSAHSRPLPHEKRSTPLLLLLPRRPRVLSWLVPSGAVQARRRACVRVGGHCCNGRGGRRCHICTGTGVASTLTHIGTGTAQVRGAESDGDALIEILTADGQTTGEQARQHVAWLHGCMVACCMVACCAVRRKVRGALFASCVAYPIVWGKYSLVRVRWGLCPSITFACGCKTDGTRGIRHTAHTWRAAHNAHVAQHVALGVRVRPRLQLLEESTRNKCKFQRGKVSSHVRRTG